MKTLKVVLLILCVFFFSCCFVAMYGVNQNTTPHQVIIENAEMRLILGCNGSAISLLHKPSGQECLEKAFKVPVFAITENRPYDNEQFLTYPAKARTYPANKIERIGNELKISFENNSYTATITLDITDNYIGFNLSDLEYEIEKFGVKRPTEIDEFTLLQLPVKKRKRFGEWLNVAWDDSIAVNILATSPYTKIDAFESETYYRMVAGMQRSVKLMNVGAALITTQTKNLLNCIDRLEKDYKLPLGVESRNREAYKYSYYELRNATPQNIDEHIYYARKGGFKMMVIYYPDFSSAMGHFPWNNNFPNGIKDLQKITKKIKQAGMIPGFHIHYNKAAKNDLYVSPVPDSRLNIVRYFTLTDSIDASSTTIRVEENPEGCTMEDGRRLLKIGNELVSYKNYTTSKPYLFTGCRRGELNSNIKSIEKGYKLGLLDVDTWPLFIRFDQKTSIQEEVGQRIAQICKDAGFEFIYFDGAEDVPPPYWFTCSKAQLDVYKFINPKPLFCEGAMKSHFSWHIITRGNAFDLFPPRYIREATRKYPMEAAKYTANDFTSINFGWNDYLAPDSTCIGMQPDMYEYICSRGAAWNCPIALMGKLDQLKKHPRTEDNLQVIRNWEEARVTNFFTEKQKEELKDPKQEHILIRDENGRFELIPYKKIENATTNSDDVQAFVFSRKSKTWVVFWHAKGKGALQIPVSVNRVSLWDKPGVKNKIIEKAKKNLIVPVDRRRFLTFDLPEEQVVKILEKSKLI